MRLPDPACDGEELAHAELSRRGRIGATPTARYQSPPPYVPQADPYEPSRSPSNSPRGSWCSAKWRTATRRRPQGRSPGRDGDGNALLRRRRRAHHLALETCRRNGRGGRPVSANDVVVAGVASPVGPSGNNFVTYASMLPARDHRRRDPVAEGRPDRRRRDRAQRLRRLRRRRDVRPGTGWNGASVATSYAACATGAQALDTARARILAGMCEVHWWSARTPPQGLPGTERRRALGRP